MNNMRGQKMSTRTFNKPKNKKKALKRLGNYISEFKGWFILAITLTIISNLFSIGYGYLWTFTKDSHWNREFNFGN